MRAKFIKENLENILKPKSFNTGDYDVTFGGQPLSYWKTHETGRHIKNLTYVKQFIQDLVLNYNDDGNNISENTILEAIMLGASLLALEGYVSDDVLESYIMQNG